MERKQLLKPKFNKKKISINKKKKAKKLFKLFICLIISFIFIFTFAFYLSYLFLQYNNKRKKEEEKIKILNKINEYLLICKNGTLINQIKKSSKIPKVTVVLILYNSEKTITTSVRSIQNQNFSDFEIIITDDYSTDKGFSIIKTLQKEDKRIKIIKNKKNRGALYSRSIGALKAKGKYILPLDSDDLFANENLFNYCYNEAEKFNIDILEFSGIICRNGKLPINKKFPKIPSYLKNKKNNFIIKAPDIRFYIYKKDKYKRFKLIDAYLWGKSIKNIIYKKALNLLGDIIYTENLCYGEDRIVNFLLFKIANSFKFVKIYGIIYNINKFSITRSHNIIKNCHDELINIMSIFNFTKNSREVEIAVYEIIHRWKTIIYPGLKNINNENYLLNLINQMMSCKYINNNDKNRIKQLYLQNS